MADHVTHRAAVLGQPIEHSLSPVLHNAGYAAVGLGEWEYSRIECDAESLPELVTEADPSFAGFSVTMPGKFAALSFADEATDRARAIGSANTLVRLPGHPTRWRADNTDCDGIAGALRELFDLPADAPLPSLTHVVIVGSGGTARPALWTLVSTGVAKVTVLNRSDRTSELRSLVEGSKTELDYRPLAAHESIAELAESADAIISTVPSAAIAGLEDSLAQAAVLDVIYEPLPTPLVKAAQAAGHPAICGTAMLAHQALSQFEQFTGHPAPAEAMRAALEAEVANR